MAFKAWQRISLLLAGLLNWISLLDLPLTAEGKDPSWELPFAYFIRHQFQAGVDYIYTYGPLGYVLTLSYDRDLFWLKYGWEIAIKLFFVGILWRISKSFPRFRDRLFFLLLAALIPPLLPPIPDAIYFFFLFAGSLYFPAAAFGALSGVLALTKFSLFLIAVFLVGIVSIRRRSPVALISFAAVLLTFWLILGQAIWNIPVYLAGSWQITSGYMDAFIKNDSLLQLALGIVVALLLAVAATPSPWFVLLGLAGVGFISFKHAFVRHDWYHAPGFFVFAALAFTCLPARPWVQRTGVALSLLALVVFRADMSPQLFFNHWKNQTMAVVRPDQLKNRLAHEYVALESLFAVPRMRGQIGAAPVDLMGGDQRRAIFNKLNWRPRPVFEGWSACTPKLLAGNAAFLSGNRAPEFIIVAWNQIDQRFPAAEDGAALLELFSRYQPVEREIDCHLFRRTGKSREVLPASIKEIRIGEALEPAPFQTASLEIKYSLLGKIRKLFYKPAPAIVRLTLESGEAKTYRFVPAIAASEFLLSPLLENLDDMIALYSGSGGKTVKRVEIQADKLWFDPKIKVMLRDFHPSS